LKASFLVKDLICYADAAQGCQITWNFFKDILSFCDYWNFTSCLLRILFRCSAV